MWRLPSREKISEASNGSDARYEMWINVSDEFNLGSSSMIHEFVKNDSEFNLYPPENEEILIQL